MASRTGLVIALAIALAIAAIPAQLTPIATASDQPHIETLGAAHSPSQEYMPSQVIVKFKQGLMDSAIETVRDQFGAKSLYRSPFAGFEVLQIDEDTSVAAIVEALSGLPEIEYAEPNVIRHAFWSPNDPYYPYQWHFDQINMESAWDLDSVSPNYGGDSSVVVAVIDSGVAYEDYSPAPGETYLQAPDLANTNFTAGYDHVNGDSHPNDDHQHGTHVCGTIAQSTNNGSDVAGVAFNITVMPVKVLDENGDGTDQQVADGIYWATNNGADIINMSLGGPGSTQTLEDAVAYAYNNGVTVVCAAGNAYQGGNPPQYPAAYDDYCIAVGATQYDQTRAPYSSTGSYLDIAAPGGNMDEDQNLDTLPDGVLQQAFAYQDPTNFGLYLAEGTSMAAPHVAGVAALILSQQPGLTPDQVRQALETTATDIGAEGCDPQFGWGLLNAPAAVSWTPSEPPEASTDSASGVTSDSALLNGTLSDKGTASSVDVSFEFATDDYYTGHGGYEYEYSAGTMGTTGPFSYPCDGTLEPGTTYHFRAKAVGDGSALGDDVIFTTDLEPPEVSTGSASGVTWHSALLNGTPSDKGPASSVDVSFEFATDDYYTGHGGYEYEYSAGTMNSTGPFSYLCDGTLEPGTTYYFRAKAAGDGSAFGDDVTFATSALGDANGDGDINMQDVTYTELVILDYEDPTQGADANGDGDINMGDVTTIELMILGYL
jgi:serine protease